MYSGTFYFLGQHKPAHFQSETLKDLRAQMRAAIKSMPADDWHWFAWRIDNIAKELRKNYSAASQEHGARGISMKKRAHDDWLHSAVADLPPFPGLDYSNALNK